MFLVRDNILGTTISAIKIVDYKDDLALLEVKQGWKWKENCPNFGFNLELNKYYWFVPTKNLKFRNKTIMDIE